MKGNGLMSKSNHCKVLHGCTVQMGYKCMFTELEQNRTEGKAMVVGSQSTAGQMSQKLGMCSIFPFCLLLTLWHGVPLLTVNHYACQ